MVKRALIYSSEIRGNRTEHLRSIFVSTYGILFLGTPHRGSDLAAWGSRLGAICRAVVPTGVVDTSPSLVKALEKDNETLQNIDRQFIQLISRFHVYFFHEGKPSALGKGAAMRFVVEEDSASPTVCHLPQFHSLKPFPLNILQAATYINYWHRQAMLSQISVQVQDVERAVIQADHSHMCKFENDGAPGFDLVAEGIQRYAGGAPALIASRWDAERAERLAKKKGDIEEIQIGKSCTVVGWEIDHVAANFSNTSLHCNAMIS